jgi:hypothetical protein
LRCQIRTLEGVVEREAVPKDDTSLCALTKARMLVSRLVALCST